jgi:asparagine synthase (glutamine-hydrolysing)
MEASSLEAQRLTDYLLSPSSDMRPVLDSPGMRVFHCPPSKGAYDAYMLQGNTGVVLGRLFQRRGKENLNVNSTFDSEESSRIVESKGRRLIDRYWGHYVGFVSAGFGQSRYVLRDPTGGIPCFFTTTASSVDVFVSSMEDFVQLNLTDFTVNWSHIIAFFMHVRLVTATTGFNEVRQLTAGECMSSDNGRRTASYYWSPVEVWSTASIDAVDEARSMLRELIRSCVGAWASCYETIVHELSGGLDSTIVLACLCEEISPSNILCLNFFTETPEGDERVFARAAADFMGCQLVEAPWSVSDQSLESRLDPSRLSTPAVLGLVGNSLSLRERLVREHDAGALFTGRGGDHLFQQDKSIFVAADYARTFGIRPGLVQAVNDTSRLTKRSVWSTFATAVRYGLLSTPVDPYSVLKVPSILADDARDALVPDDYRHAWVDAAAGLPPCKIQQIFDVVDCQPFAQMPNPYPALIHPLISQPIIELCLQIPSYLLAHGGRERGLVREAFRINIPTSIFCRESKGGTTSYFNRMLGENLSFLRTLLLEGSLVREGIIGRSAMERELSDRAIMRGNEISSVLKAMRAEAWIRNWTGVCKGCRSE